MKNVLLSGLGGGIVFFLLGGLFYAGLFAEFFSNNIPSGMENVPKEEVILPMILVADLLLGLLLAYVFDKFASVRSFSRGAWLGMLLALAFALNYNMIFSATTNMTTPITSFADICISAFSGALGGGVIGLILGKLSKA